MVRVLVPVHYNDVHAKAVRRALAHKGHEAVLLYGGDVPTRLHTSIELDEESGLSWKLSGSAPELTDKQFDVVWYRRPTAPMFPESMSPGERDVASREWEALTRGFWGLVAPQAFWVNPLEGRARAFSKPIQLSAAIDVGLRIPPTLFSNAPEDIKKFIARYPGEAIYKGFRPAVWEMEGGLSRLLTTSVEIEDLPDDSALMLCPGIFQKRMEKDYEVRATFMGDYCVAAKLLSQEHEDTKLDWRTVPDRVRNIPYELPKEIALRCRLLMNKLGIVFGCFDFIVTPNGDYVFLEVNEMGQFLWLEETTPEILMLESFCSFLQNCGLSESWHPSGEVIHLADFLLDASEDAEEERLHVRTPPMNRFRADL
jgi:hypothetical protein